jgi:flagellar motor switch protein FliN
MKEPSEIRLWLIRTIAEQLNQVLETMAGESPLTESTTDAAKPDVGSAFWEINLSSAPGSTILLAATKSNWMELGGRVLTAAGLEESDEETISSTFRETLDQAISGMAQSATSQLGREVTATPLKSSSYSSKAEDQWTSVDLVFGDAKSIQLSFLWNDKLVLGFAAQPEPPPPPAASASTGSLPPTQAMSMAAAAGVAAGGRAAEVLYDVELPVSVSFGRAHLQLKDVMKLTTGSIVELNRTVSEPVEIIVNNCVIARGEVVVVEGNFGVRINEVISRQERLRTLH